MGKDDKTTNDKQQTTDDKTTNDKRQTTDKKTKTLLLRAPIVAIGAQKEKLSNNSSRDFNSESETMNCPS